MAKVSSEEVLQLYQEIIHQTDDLCRMSSNLCNKISLLNDFVEGDDYLPQITEESRLQFRILNSMREGIIQSYSFMEERLNPFYPPLVFPKDLIDLIDLK